MNYGKLSPHILLGALLVAGLTGCATTPQREDGLVGILVQGFSNKSSPTLDEPVQVQEKTPQPAPAVEEPGEPALEPVLPPRYDAAPVYRACPGDLLSITYFRKPPGTNPPPYRVDCLDVLTISVVGQELFSKDVTVRPDGCISFFQVGDLPVRGKTVEEVRKLIATEYGKIIPSAEIAVFLKEGNVLSDRFLATLMSDQTRGAYRTWRIGMDGLVNFPIIGQRALLGKSLVEISQELETQYNEALAGGLSVTVNLVSSTDENVVIVGEVKQPGAYPITRPVRPMEALAMAGGHLDTAGLGKVVLVRRLPDGSFNRTYVNLSDQLAGRVSSRLTMNAQDILIVPKSTIANLDLFVDQYLRRLSPVPIGFGVSYQLNPD